MCTGRPQGKAGFFRTQQEAGAEPEGSATGITAMEEEPLGSQQELQEKMCACAEWAVVYARGVFEVELDYSEASLRQIERMMSVLFKDRHRSWLARWLRPGPTEEEVRQVALLLGAYIGEVIRRHHGGQWAFHKRLGLQLLPLITHGVSTYPLSKAYQRLTYGPEEDVWSYYQVLRSELAQAQS
jgi:hypothetical protein